MPDIMDVTRKHIAEIKPFSPYGIVTGPIQLAAYLTVANGFSVSYNGRQITPTRPAFGGGWSPSTWLLGVRIVPNVDPNYLVFTLGNFGGLIFYKAFYKPTHVLITAAIMKYVADKLSQYMNAFKPQMQQVLVGGTAIATGFSHFLDWQFTKLLVGSMITVGTLASLSYLQAGIGLRMGTAVLTRGLA